MEKTSRIYVAGHRGMVGSAIVRLLEEEGYTNLILRTHQALMLFLRKKDIGLQTLIIVPIINVFGLTVKIGLPLSMDPLVQVPQQQKTLRFFLMLVLPSMHILI